MLIVMSSHGYAERCHRNKTTELPKAKDNSRTKPVIKVVTSIRGGPTAKAAPLFAFPFSVIQRLKVGEPCAAVACVLPVLVFASVS